MLIVVLNWTESYFILLPGLQDIVGICLLIYFFLSSQGEGLPLLSGEKKEIEELLPATTSEEDKDTIFSILGQAMCRPTGIQVESDSFSRHIFTWQMSVYSVFQMSLALSVCLWCILTLSPVRSHICVLQSHETFFIFHRTDGPFQQQGLFQEPFRNE